MITGDNKLSFKSGMRTLAHTVTSQAFHSFSTISSTSPVHYFEVRVLKMQDKEANKFGIGLSKKDFPYLRVVGGKESVGVRGDGKIFVNDIEEKNVLLGLLGGAIPGDKSIVNSVVGVGYEVRSAKVFFTLNGHEVFSVASKTFDSSEVYPTFSMGSLDDKIHVNFGQTQFLFNIKAKINVSNSICSMLTKLGTGVLQENFHRDL